MYELILVFGVFLLLMLILPFMLFACMFIMSVFTKYLEWVAYHLERLLGGTYETASE